MHDIGEIQLWLVVILGLATAAISGWVEANR